MTEPIRVAVYENEGCRVVVLVARDKTPSATFGALGLRAIIEAELPASVPTVQGRVER